MRDLTHTFGKGLALASVLGLLLWGLLVFFALVVLT